ncbi:MAG: hypothetical protein ACREQQ_06605 [Candidatus Binatia bacterium]
MSGRGLRDYASVARWIENVDRYYQLGPEEWEQRLGVLGKFCERVGKDPDTLVGEALEERSAKVDLIRTLKRVAREVTADARAAHDWDNVVRSFFIHNGARVVVRPYEE